MRKHDKKVYPLIKRIYNKLLASDIVSVYPSENSSKDITAITKDGKKIYIAFHNSNEYPTKDIINLIKEIYPHAKFSPFAFQYTDNGIFCVDDGYPTTGYVYEVDKDNNITIKRRK